MGNQCQIWLSIGSALLSAIVSVVLSYYAGKRAGVLSGRQVAEETRKENEKRDMPANIEIASWISHSPKDGKYRIKFLNELDDYAIALNSSYFIMSYKSPYNTTDNYRYKIPIAGESISYIHPKKDDNKGNHRNDKTFASLIIDAQKIERFRIETPLVSDTIQKKYKEYHDGSQNNSEGRKITSPLSINDFFVEDQGASLIAVLVLKNLNNNIDRIITYTYYKDDVKEADYVEGRSFESYIPSNNLPFSN